MYCHPERSEGSLYGLPTSCPLLFPDIVDQQASRDAASRGSPHCSRWLRCWYTSRVTMLVLHTETLRCAQGDSRRDMPLARSADLGRYNSLSATTARRAHYQSLLV